MGPDKDRLLELRRLCTILMETEGNHMFSNIS